MTRASDSPILKIGAVVLRVASSSDSKDPQSRHHASKSMDVLITDPCAAPHASKGMDVLMTDPCATPHHILILQPIPKRAGEVPSFVLPRGTRQYRDASGAWHDARDAATGEMFRDSLEPFTRGLAREVEEEAGVTVEMLARAQVTPLGPLAFQSRSKGVYPIYWFIVALAESDAATLTDTLPIDALSVRWATLAELREMAARGEFSAGYVPVIERALYALHTRP